LRAAATLCAQRRATRAKAELAGRGLVRGALLSYQKGTRGAVK